MSEEDNAETPPPEAFPDEVTDLIQVLANEIRIDIIRALASPEFGGQIKVRDLARILHVSTSRLVLECDTLADERVLKQDSVERDVYTVGERLRVMRGEHEGNVRVRILAGDIGSHIEFEFPALSGDGSSDGKKQ